MQLVPTRLQLFLRFGLGCFEIIFSFLGVYGKICKLGRERCHGKSLLAARGFHADRGPRKVAPIRECGALSLMIWTVSLMIWTVIVNLAAPDAMKARPCWRGG